MKKYQEVNREKFSSRWKETLDKENFDDMKGDAFLARDRSKNRKVVLFMDNNVPTFDKDAGSFIAFQYIKVLNDLNYKVIFWPHNLEKIEPYTDILQQMGVEVMYGERNFSEYINKYGESIDFAFVSRPHVAEAYMYLIRKKSSAKIFYIAHDLHFLREMRAAEVGKDKNLEKIASDTKKIEESMMSKSDVSLFFSGDEVKIVKKEFAEVSVDVLPWVQNIENSSPADFKDRKGLIFMGGYNHPPNVDAVKWFHKEVFPLVIKKVPNIEVTIYGSHVPKEISSLNARNFKVIGFIEEEKIKDIFDSAKIFIAPLRFGAGFKGKIAKAMSNGLPVITTDIGAEGMGLVDGENALIGNDSEAVANKIIRLYSDEALWNKISKNSLRYIGDNYSVDNAQHKIEKLLASDMGCKKYS
jgi:glycosyltransferase involved in cell wall biosynthesis